MIRAWQSRFGTGLDGFKAARALGGWCGEWSFISRQLGGKPLGGGPDIPIPTLTGWGDPAGTGFTLSWVGQVSTPRINSPINRSIFVSPASVSITGESLSFNDDSIAVTNLSLFVNGALLSSQPGPARLITANRAPLSAGSYVFATVADGYSGSHPVSLSSLPVRITVVDPVEILVAPPQIAGGQFQFRYAANQGLKYVIKTSADLFNWQPIVTNIPDSSPALFSQPFNAAATRYFKVERLPNP